MKIITKTLTMDELREMLAIGNRSRGVDNEETRKKIIAVVAKRIKR